MQWQSSKGRGSNDETASFAAELQTYNDTLAEDGFNTTIPFVSPLGGTLFGYNMSIIPDVTGDGLSELVVTARDDAPTNTRSGSAFLYPGTEDGVEMTPVPTHAGFWGHNSNAQYGQSVTLGDVDSDGVDEWIVVGHSAVRPKGSSMLNGAEVADSCGNSANTAGVVWVFEPTDLLEADVNPSRVIYSHQGGNRLHRVVSGFDWNGDGYSDIAYGSVAWDKGGTSNVGGVGVVYGGPAAEVETEIRCAPDVVFYGRAKSDNMGRGIASLGDLDGDGCDELAVSSWKT